VPLTPYLPLIALDGCDVSRCDRRAVPIVRAEQLGRVMLEKLAELLDEEQDADTRVRSRRAA
jgi:hypothetical protein